MSPSPNNDSFGAAIHAKTLVQANTLESNRTMSPDDWAGLVHQELQNIGENLTYLTALASHYLSHLIIACKLFSLLGHELNLYLS